MLIPKRKVAKRVYATIEHVKTGADGYKVNFFDFTSKVVVIPHQSFPRDSVRIYCSRVFVAFFVQIQPKTGYISFDFGRFRAYLAGFGRIRRINRKNSACFPIRIRLHVFDAGWSSTSSSDV